MLVKPLLESPLGARKSLLRWGRRSHIDSPLPGFPARGSKETPTALGLRPSELFALTKESQARNGENAPWPVGVR
jgi:hypothetical protein